VFLISQTNSRQAGEGNAGFEQQGASGQLLDDAGSRLPAGTTLRVLQRSGATDTGTNLWLIAERQAGCSVGP
jgi:hypothetical protein